MVGKVIIQCILYYPNFYCFFSLLTLLFSKQSFLWNHGDLDLQRLDNISNNENKSINNNGNEDVNNNLQINIVKCRITNTANTDYVNTMANNVNQTINDNCLINKLITEFENIDFNEPNNIKRKLRSNQNNTDHKPFTQGDYLNEIKLKRMNVANCRNNASSFGSKSNQNFDSACSSMDNSTIAIKLDPNKYDSTNK